MKLWENHEDDLSPATAWQILVDELVVRRKITTEAASVAANAGNGTEALRELCVAVIEEYIGPSVPSELLAKHTVDASALASAGAEGRKSRL